MTKPAITTLSALNIVPSSTSKNNGVYFPQITLAQKNAIPANLLRNGCVVYQTDDAGANTLQLYANGAWVTITAA